MEREEHEARYRPTMSYDEAVFSGHVVRAAEDGTGYDYVDSR